MALRTARTGVGAARPAGGHRQHDVPDRAGDETPTPTGQIVRDFLERRFPFYCRTGLNFIGVADLSHGLQLVAASGQVGERYLLSGENLWLKEFLDLLAQETGLPAPRMSLPNAVIRLIGCAGEAVDFFNPRSTIARAFAWKRPCRPSGCSFSAMTRHEMSWDGNRLARPARVSWKPWPGSARRRTSNWPRPQRPRWNRMSSNLILAVWSAAGLVWWIIAWRLAARSDRAQQRDLKTSARQTLSVFKPLPPLGSSGLKYIASGLKSFAAQLDAEAEMLLGIHEADRDIAAPFLERLRAEHPEARIKVIFRSEPDRVANPKIAWQKVLAREAEGELWLWSDADIVAPSGFLHSARREYEEFARTGVAMLTFPYLVREIRSMPSLLQALFVNVEFYPGVLLLRALGPVDFGLGAAMLFRRDDFLRKVDWNELGTRLADDFFLGQMLQPVRVGHVAVATVPGVATWKEAIANDIRWTKTIRWSRPFGSFARILILPVFGWLAAVALAPTHLFAWLGLLGMIQAEVLFAAAICRGAGCRLQWRHVAGLELWSFWRIILWFVCWLPWPVQWSEKLWRGPKMEFDHEVELEGVRS